MKRVTIGRAGAHRRVFVLESGPFPHVGDEITLKGDAKPYKVRSVQDVDDPVITLKFPAARLKRTDVLAKR